MKRIHLIFIVAVILLAIAFYAPSANSIESSEKGARILNLNVSNY